MSGSGFKVRLGSNLKFDSPKRSQGLQIARAVAATSVFIHHFVWYSQSFFGFHVTGVPILGTCGVVIFFVLSGYLMTGSLIRGDQTFLANRVLRIYPSFLIAAFVVMGTKILLWGGLGPVSHVTEALTLLPFGNVSYPLFVEWSLVFEVCFYLLIAFTLFWRRLRLHVFVLILFVWILIIALREEQSEILNVGFKVFTSSWCIALIAGSVLKLVLYAKIIKPFSTSKSQIFGTLLGILATITSFYVFDFNSNLYLLALSLSSCLCILSLIEATSRSFLVQIGNYSYGIYLLHVPLITILMSLMSQHLSWNKWISISLTLIISALTSHLFGLFDFYLYRYLRRLKL